MIKKVRKAVIPVAGLGTRFLPITKALPKEMLPIVDKPILQYIIEEAAAAGIEEVLLITSSYKKVIEDHFDRSYELESRLEKNNKQAELKQIRAVSELVKIYYIRQGAPLGSGHALNLAKSFVGDEPFAVLYGDDLMEYEKDEPVLKQLMNTYEQYDCNVIGVQQVADNLVYKYGIIKFKEEATGLIETIIEKPEIGKAPSNWAGLGRYIIKPEIFTILKDLKVGAGNEIQFTDAMKELMKRQSFYACKFKGNYYDTGSKIGYLKANLHYAWQRTEFKAELKEIIKNLK